MSGYVKLTAVIALACGGKLGQEVAVYGAVQAAWRKSLFQAKYSPSYYDRAQGEGWLAPTGKSGRCRLTQDGLDYLTSLIEQVQSGDLNQTGALIIVNRRGSHSFDKFLRSVLASTKREVLIADPWVDGTIFDRVLDVDPKSARFHFIYSNDRDGSFLARSRRFAEQYPHASFRKYKHLHDRFLIADKTGLVLGPSIKDGATDYPALIVSLPGRERDALTRFFQELWQNAG